MVLLLKRKCLDRQCEAVKVHLVVRMGRGVLAARDTSVGDERGATDGTRGQGSHHHVAEVGRAEFCLDLLDAGLVRSLDQRGPRALVVRLGEQVDAGRGVWHGLQHRRVVADELLEVVPVHVRMLDDHGPRSDLVVM